MTRSTASSLLPPRNIDKTLHIFTGLVDLCNFQSVPSVKLIMTCLFLLTMHISTDRTLVLEFGWPRMPHISDFNFFCITGGCWCSCADANAANADVADVAEAADAEADVADGLLGDVAGHRYAGSRLTASQLIYISNYISQTAEHNPATGMFGCLQVS